MSKKAKSEIDRRIKRLDSTLLRLKKLDKEIDYDLQISSDIAKYFCVLVSGFLEQSIIYLIIEYSEDKSHKNIARFIEQNIDHWTNPKKEKIKNLLGSFKKEWGEKVEKTIIDQKHELLDSMIANRHNIVHGNDVGITVTRVESFYKNAKCVLLDIQNIINEQG
jgi:hypothetical protein